MQPRQIRDTSIPERYGIVITRPCSKDMSTLCGHDQNTRRESYVADRPCIVAFGRRAARGMEPAGQKCARKTGFYLVGFMCGRHLFFPSPAANTHLSHPHMAVRPL